MSSISELDASWLSGMEEVFANQQAQNLDALLGSETNSDGTSTGEVTSFSEIPEVANFTDAIMNIKDTNEDGLLTMDEVNNDTLFQRIDADGDEEITEEELTNQIRYDVKQFSDVMNLLMPNSDLKGTSELSELMGNDAQPSTAMFKQLMQQAS